ncbi:MAG TPA: hypothetical protein VEA41_05530 [Salinarimonas sp.]|nr:hypothetical protein [Salinarimonas sp.]
MVAPAIEAPTTPTGPTAPAPAAASEAPPSVPAPAAPEGGSEPASAADAASLAQDAPENAAPSIRDSWKTLSPQERAELLKETDWEEVFGASDWLKGKVGAAKQRTQKEQEQERAALEADIRAKIEKDLEERRLLQLAEQDDLVGLGEATKQKLTREQAEKQRKDAAARDEARLASLAQAEVQAVGEALYGALSPDLQEKVKGKQYAPDGTPRDGVIAFVQEMTQLRAEQMAEAIVKERLPKAVEAAVEARLKEANNDRFAGAPSPDTRGVAPAQGAITRALYQANKNNAEWIDRYGTEAARQAAAGWPNG